MLQLNFIKNNRELAIKRLAIKNFEDPLLIDKIIGLDEERKTLQQEYETLQGKINATSRQIGELMQKGDKIVGEAKKIEVVELKSFLQPVSEKLQAVEQELNESLVALPNIPHESVPPGKTPQENEIVREGGKKPALHQQAVPHWDLAKKYDLINFDLGNKVTGSGFPFYKNKGAKLQRSLVQFFLDYNVNAGYMEYEPPFLVNEASAYGTGQLPDKEGQMYFVGEDNLFLIPTAEVPITNIFRDEIVREEDLPLKLTGYTPCFRREAGSYGKDVRGLNRVHQFDKVEIVQIVHPSKSYEVLEEMVDHIEKLLQ